MKKTIPLFLFIFSTLLYSCSNQNCNKLPANFSSYEEALTQIESSSFKIEESVNTSKSSWIRSASYYSCDGKKGYLLIETDSKTYIHKNIPLSVWEGFKEADSFGRFYSLKIKGVY